MISKKSVEVWCRYNNYLLINLKDKNISISKIMTIAEKSVGIRNFHKYKHRSTFARDMAICYLWKRYPRREIMAELEISEGLIWKGERKKILEEGKQFKEVWKNNAVKFFKEKIEKIESKLSPKLL